MATKSEVFEYIVLIIRTIMNDSNDVLIIELNFHQKSTHDDLYFRITEDISSDIII